MSRDKIVGFRVSKELHEKLFEMAKEQDTSISDIVRDIVLENLDLSYRYSQWEIHAWRLFGITSDQLNYAKRTSKNADQFFSTLSKWSKDIKINIIPNKDYVSIEFTRQGVSQIIDESRILPKMQIIQSIVDKLQDSITTEVLDEAQNLCDGATGGDISSTDKEQPDKPRLNLSEGSGSQGYTSLSDFDESGMVKRPSIL